MAADPRKVSLYIPDSIRTVVQDWALENNRSVSYAVQQALIHWLDNDCPETEIVVRRGRPAEGGAE